MANNRKRTKARRRQIIELERAIIVGKEIKLEKTGKTRTIYHQNFWKWGGNTTHPGRQTQR